MLYIYTGSRNGKGVSVVDADGLMKALAIWLVNKPSRLTGKELRFLRALLCLSQHVAPGSAFAFQVSAQLSRSLARRHSEFCWRLTVFT